MNIVAMGGGSREKAFVECRNLISYENSNVIIIPTACSTPKSYTTKVGPTMERFRNLGLKPEVLHDYDEIPSRTKLEHELGKASIIYTIGGNTPYLLNKLHKFGGFDMIKHAILDGTVHAGTSAGALLPFSIAHSNIAARPAEVEWDYHYLEGLDAVEGVATAHANQYDPTPKGRRKDSRFEALLATFPEMASVGYAIDNDASLVVTNGLRRAIRDRNDAKVQILTRDKDGAMSVDEIDD